MIRQAASGVRFRQPGRWWHFLFAAVLVLLSLPVFATLVLALRLWIAPIDVTESARRLARDALPGLSFKRVRLSWNGWGEGPSAPLGLLASGVRLDDPSIGRARAASASAALDLPALLHGRIAVVALRADDGGIDPQQAGRPTGGARLDWRKLSRIELSRMAIGVRVRGRSCRARVDDMRLAPLHRPAAVVVTGSLRGALSCGGAALSVSAVAREAPKGGIVWHAASDSFIPARLGAALPALAALDLPVRLTLDAALSGGFGWHMLPRHLDVRARLGAGVGAGVAIGGGLLHLTLDLPDTDSGTLRAALLPSTLRLDTVQGTAAAPELRLTGSLSRTGATITGRLRARVTRFDFAGLDRLWSASWAADARRWVSANITAGIGHDGSASAELASADGWRALHLVRLQGGLDAEGLTLFWLRPMPPLTRMDAHLVLEGPDSLRIEGRHAMELAPSGDAIAVGPTAMRITGLSRKDQLGRIDTMLSGALPGLLSLLAQPRLHLLSQHPLPFTEVSGMASVHLGVSLPLLDSVSIDDIPIRAEATLRHLHLGHAVAGRPLDAAMLAMSASNAGLALHGQCAIGGVPARLSYTTDFRDSAPGGAPGQVVETAHVSARIDPAALERAGLRAARRMRGTARLDADYARRRSGAARIALAVDLTDAGLATPIWRKQPGTKAHVSAVIGLERGRLVAIDSVEARGDGLALDGHGEIRHGTPSALVIRRFAIGRSRGQGRIDLPTRGTHGAVSVALRGESLDLAPYAETTSSGSGLSQPAGDWRMDLGFDRVLLGDGRWLGGVRLEAASRDGRIASGRLAIAAPTPVQASLWMDGAERRLHGQAMDVGLLLAALGISRRIKGGALTLDADQRDHQGFLLAGTASVGRFTVRDAPLAARLARDLSLYGLLFGAPSPQLVVTRLTAPFTWQDGALRLIGARASDAALGVTLRGVIDLRQDRLDLHGTIVPSYLPNALPGQLPGVGRVFSPERGGGLLAATLRVTGPLDTPAISVNPLSLLAPGILRRLLFD